MHKLLLIENEKFSRDLVREILGQKYEIVEAFSGEEAMKRIESINPDLVLMEVDLPMLDGIGTAKQIRSKFDLKPIIFLTNKRPNEIDNGILTELNISGFITKPFNPDELISKIKKILM